MQLTNTTQQSNRLLTPEEAAKHIGVTLSTIWRYCREGGLPHIRITSRCYRVRQSDLEAFLNSRTR